MDEVTLLDELEALLKQQPHIGEHIYVGYVPGEVATDPTGKVLPYAVLFAGLGSDLPAERDLSQLADTTVLDWAPQINAVGPTAGHALKVAVQLRKALVGARVGNHWLKPNEDSFRVEKPILDTTVSPARFYLPMNFVLITN